MNKSQIILAAIGGTVVVGALVLGYFIWDASSVKAEHAETLEDNITAASGLMKQLPMKPEQAELKVYKDGVAAYGEWKAEAQKLAARGDLVFEKMTPAEFKTALVAEARKFAELPGCFNGKIVKPDFGFGFKDYVTGGAMPPEATLKRLQREWNDVSAVLGAIATCGAPDVGIVDVRMGAKAKVEAEGEGDAKPKKKGKKKAKAKVKVESEGESEGVAAVTSFTVEFMTRPSGLVKVINSFATGTRFVVVEDFSFVREKDELAEKLGGDAKKQTEATSSRRRRRGAAQQQEEKKPEATVSALTDPATAPLLKVTMAISVHDFGSLEEDKAKEEDEGEGDEKAKEKGTAK